MESVDSGGPSGLGTYQMCNNASYLDADLDDFEQHIHTQQLAADFEALTSLPGLLPNSSHPILVSDGALEKGLTQPDVWFTQTGKCSYETSPFEDSLLSFDNASACFSWPSSAAPGFPADTDSLMLENASETWGSAIATTPVTSVKGHERRRRPNLRFPRSSVQVLEFWLSEHTSSPYPTDQDKSELKKQTGLKRSQISSWFANARKRGKVKPPSASIAAVPELPTLKLPGIEKIHPFDRWRLAPLEYEAASIVDIARAVAREARPCDPVEHYSRTKSRRSKSISQISGYLGYSTASNISMDVTSRPGVQSVADAQSQNSLAFSSRRRRRRQTIASSSRSVNVGLTTKRFQCTFCSDFFQRKHDWQRHEKSQHLPLESWTCSPHGPTNVNHMTNAITCVFCDAPDPTPEHIQHHGYFPCLKRFPAERIFYRKDHLRQHLRLMHSNCAFIDSMKAWNSSSPAIRSRCGFCMATFQTWPTRVAHLAEHFIAGATMREWRGDWGLEPQVMNILERATLPESIARLAEEQTNEDLDHVSLPAGMQLLESGQGSLQSTNTANSAAMDTIPSSGEWGPKDLQQQAEMYPFDQDFGIDQLQAYYPTSAHFGLGTDPPAGNQLPRSTLGANADVLEFRGFEMDSAGESLPYPGNIEEDGNWRLPEDW